MILSKENPALETTDSSSSLAAWGGYLPCPQTFANPCLRLKRMEPKLVGLSSDEVEEIHLYKGTQTLLRFRRQWRVAFSIGSRPIYLASPHHPVLYLCLHPDLTFANQTVTSQGQLDYLRGVCSAVRIRASADSHPSAFSTQTPPHSGHETVPFPPRQVVIGRHECPENATRGRQRSDKSSCLCNVCKPMIVIVYSCGFGVGAGSTVR